MVKADGYGHGMVESARSCLAGGASALCVATVHEAETLRRALARAQILLLNAALPEDAARVAAARATPVVSSLAFARAFSKVAVSGAEVHLNADTGIGRDGMGASEIRRLLADRAMRRLRVTCEMSHFCRSDGPRDPLARLQLARLRAVLPVVARHATRLLVHAANSSALLAFPESWLDAVRPGLLLYGVPPFERPPAGSLRMRLEPAMQVCARVTAVKRLATGETLGYGPLYRATRGTVVATVSMGYADGVRRALSGGRGAMLLGGSIARILSTVNMDLTTLDATGIRGVAPGYEATLIGTSGRRHQSAWDVARACGTIPYEVLCSFGGRVAREHRA